MHVPPALRSSCLRRLIGRLAADERGYTITELLTVLAILGIVVTSFATVFASASKAEVDMNLRFQAQQQARLALDRLRREAHCAAGVTPATAFPTTRVVLTFGPQCRQGVDIAASTTLSAALDGTSTTFTVGVVHSAFPNVPFNVQVNTEIMRVTGIAGSTWTVQRAQVGTAAAAHVSGSLVRQGRYAITWCTLPTAGTGTRHALRRIDGAASTCTGGVAVADHLTSGEVFTAFTTQSPTRRASLGLSFTVDIDPENAMRVYRLQDAVVLRNTPRTS